MDLAIMGKLIQTPTQFTQGDVDGVRYVLDRELGLLPHIENEPTADGVPMAYRHVATQDPAGHHAGEIDRVLRAPERWGVAEFGLLEVVNGGPKLDRQGKVIDTLVHAVLSDRLRPEHPTVGLAEQDLHGDRLGPGVIASM
jgi:hypothetical protein